MSDSIKPSTSQGEPTNMSPNSTPVRTAIIKNWKTTAIGITLSFTGFVAFSPSTFGGEQTPFVQVCKYVTSGGLAALGIASKDFNVTGGSEEA
jgi:hypothetical protein